VDTRKQEKKNESQPKQLPGKEDPVMISPPKLGLNEEAQTTKSSHVTDPGRIGEYVSGASGTGDEAAFSDAEEEREKIEKREKREKRELTLR
jgi:hypothetical protein